MARVGRYLILWVLAATAMMSVPAGAQSPAQVADDLLAADRAFSAASMATDTVSGLSAMFADSVVMPAPGETFTHSKAEAVALLRGNPLNLTSHTEWTPIRAGVSADGLHGFTLGYMKIHDQDGPGRSAKYLSYWVRHAEGWRVAFYKRSPQGPGDFSAAIIPAHVPAKLVAPVENAAAMAEARQSLDAAERGFSDEAQIIGLGPAFCKNGARDAMNLAGPDPSIKSGLDTICSTFPPADPAGPKSPVHWAPVDVFVASSGDFGITWGLIRPNGTPAEGQPAAFPYSTIWVRSGPGQPWRYIAE